MPDISSGLAFAWYIAAAEAVHARHECIAPAHLFIGLCSLEKALDPEVQRQLGVTDDAAAALRTEWGALTGLFARFSIDPAVRRELRQRVGIATFNEQPRQPSSSPASRAVFTRAVELAAGMSPVTTLHLLAALLDNTDGSIVELLREKGVNITALQTAALAVAPRPEATRKSETGLQVDILTEHVDPNAIRLLEVPDVEPDVEIAEALEANVLAVPPADAAAMHAAQRLALLCELSLQFAGETRLDALTHTILERLVAVIPGAARGALLLRDQANNALLLKAHLSPGGPAVSETLARRTMAERKGFIWRRSDDDSLGGSILHHHIETGMYAPLLWQGEALGVVCVDNPQRDSTFTDEDLRLLLTVAHYAAMAVANQRLQEQLRRESAVKANLLQHFSPKIAERLLHHRGRLRLGGERSEVTILCSDVRGFTNLSKDMEPDDVVEMLNDYFARLIPVIFAYDGTVDKYVGDAILAVFGSPEPDGQQHEKAVQAALGMQAAMQAVNTMRMARGLVTCGIGIGVHCGEVVHGFIGTPEQMEFTVIGDAVNRAARYCDGASPGEVLISPAVYERVWKLVQAEPTTIETKHEGPLDAYRIKESKV